ncbi:MULTISPECIES: acyl-CoA dehydrogenase family protein [Oceanobacillus]|uniref:Acyl-CoA dehydrogenase n=1 Tax=Oceanobacillus indicireducens TaxID=1004261 RepID=A0A918D4R0_9BACI|nr:MULTISPECIES: acyl-CoA dehydrogenase family protein [Oceanobacillus]GGN67117.1 acyl-CoA dehydrogenase [Oceanobacillus indicireducens]
MGRNQSLSNSQSIFPNATPSCFTEKSEEETLIAKTIEQFLEKNVIPRLNDLEVHDYQTIKQLFSQAGELGLLGADVPEAYGGLAMGKKTAGLIAEKMGFGGSFSVAFNIHTGAGTLPYVYFGTEVQKETYVSKLASGEWIGAYALTEPGSGSDALAANTTAILDTESEEWILNGEKQWITNAHVADVFVVFAKTAAGMTAFIIERKLSGVSIGPEENKLGIKGSSTATLILEDVRIPKENVLGKVGKGHHIALNIMNLARLKLAFANIGTAKQALELAVNYGKERKQFQQPITNFTMIQEKIANMIVAIYGAESAAYYTASLLDKIDSHLEGGKDIVNKLSNFAMDCAINKVYASETLDWIVDESLQIHGGYGYMQDYEIERLYRDVRINRIFEGTNEINRLTITKFFLNKYEKDSSLIEQVERIDQQGNLSFVQLSESLLLIIMKTLLNLDKEKLQNEQECSRLLADVIQELYVMKAAVLRCEKAATNQSIQKLITETLCEEGYRKIERAAISIIASIVSDKSTKQRLFDEMKALPVPLYTNLFAKKRKLAMEVVDHQGYFI